MVVGAVWWWLRRYRGDCAGMVVAPELWCRYGGDSGGMVVVRYWLGREERVLGKRTLDFN